MARVIPLGTPVLSSSYISVILADGSLDKISVIRQVFAGILLLASFFP